MDGVRRFGLANANPRSQEVAPRDRNNLGTIALASAPPGPFLHAANADRASTAWTSRAVIVGPSAYQPARSKCAGASS